MRAPTFDVPLPPDSNFSLSHHREAVVRLENINRVSYLGRVQNIKDLTEVKRHVGFYSEINCENFRD